MVTAIVLMHVEGDRVDEVAQRLINFKGVSEVYSIAGGWDLAAVLRVTRNEEVADLVTKKILKISGVEETETLIAFKAYSRHDLDRMFSVGFPETEPRAARPGDTERGGGSLNEGSPDEGAPGQGPRPV